MAANGQPPPRTIIPQILFHMCIRHKKLELATTHDKCVCIGDAMKLTEVN